MTSDRQMQANRRNARRSTGPTSPQGKANASCNARRHGFEATRYRDATTTNEIARIARMIGHPDAGPLQREQLTIIAECTVIIEQIRAHRSGLLGQKEQAEPHISRESFEPDIKCPTNPNAMDYWTQFEEWHYQQYLLRQLARTTKCSIAPASEPKSPWAPEDESTLQALNAFESLERYETRAISRRRRALVVLCALRESKRSAVSVLGRALQGNSAN